MIHVAKQLILLGACVSPDAFDSLPGLTRNERVENLRINLIAWTHQQLAEHAAFRMVPALAYGAWPHAQRFLIPLLLVPCPIGAVCHAR